MQFLTGRKLVDAVSRSLVWDTHFTVQ